MTTGEAPFRSVAVLSDIHGVLPALDAVLAEPDVQGADCIVLNGDVAAGPQPSAVMDRLVALDGRAVWVRGNADRELVALARGGGTTAHSDINEWAASQLSSEHVGRLAELPHPVVLDVVGFGSVLFCHGTPRSDEEVVLVDTRAERWVEVLSELSGEVGVVVLGHTHMPFFREVDRRLIVNPGSVGMPYGSVGAHWALLRDGAVSLRTTSFDVDGAVATIALQSAYPGAAEWANEYVRALNSDIDALEVLGPLDGRTAPSSKKS